MNFKKYHVSRNLFVGDYSQFDNTGGTGTTYAYFKIDEDFTLSFKARNNLTVPQDYYVGISANGGNNSSGVTWAIGSNNTIAAGDVRTVKSSTNNYHCFSFYPKNQNVFDWLVENFEVMLNTGSTALPYEPYSSEVWHDTPHYIHNTSTDSIATLPAVLYPNDTTATVGLKGNMSQSGTPSPDNPIQPQECGERTGNLFDKTATDTNNGFQQSRILLETGNVDSNGSYNVSEYIQINPNEQYTLTEAASSSRNASICFYDSSYEYITGEKYDNRTIVTVTTPSQAAFVRVCFQKTKSDVCMLNSGSSPLPFEPYGYKIPILSNSTTTPIYLGEVETTRKIKKLVLTGDETSWVTLDPYYTVSADNVRPWNGCICTHCAYNGIIGGNSNTRLWIKQTSFPDYQTLEDFKAYLAAQYANGTPVTIWYVLAESTTGIVNEPIRKIGDYADTVSGISIPVTAGGDTLSVDTTLQPSEVMVGYKGWHPVQNVHEKSKNLFDKDRTNDIIDNSYINTSGGTSTNSGYYISYPIYLTVGETYTWRFDNVQVHSAPTIGFYDNSNNLMGVAPHDASVTNFSFTVPSGCAYVKCSVYKSLQSEAMLNEGSTALPYEPYWK